MDNKDIKILIDDLFEDICNFNHCLDIEDLSEMEKCCIISFFNSITKKIDNLTKNVNGKYLKFLIENVNERNNDIYDILSDIGNKKNNTKKIEDKMFLDTYFQDLQNALYKAKKTIKNE